MLLIEPPKKLLCEVPDKEPGRTALFHVLWAAGGRPCEVHLRAISAFAARVEPMESNLAADQPR